MAPLFWSSRSRPLPTANSLFACLVRGQRRPYVLTPWSPVLVLAGTPDFRASCMGEHAGAAHWLELEYLAAHQLWDVFSWALNGHPETLEHFSNLPPTMDTLCDQQRAQAQGIARSHIARANAMEALKFK